MHRIGYVVFPRFQLMGFAAVTAFEVANLALGEQAYEIELLSEGGGEIKSSAGFGVLTKAFDGTIYDTVMFGAGTEIEPVSPGLVAFARHALKASRRVAAPCTGGPAPPPGALPRAVPGFPPRPPPHDPLGIRASVAGAFS